MCRATIYRENLHYLWNVVVGENTERDGKLGLLSRQRPSEVPTRPFERITVGSCQRSQSHLRQSRRLEYSRRALLHTATTNSNFTLTEMFLFIVSLFLPTLYVEQSAVAELRWLKIPIYTTKNNWILTGKLSVCFLFRFTVLTYVRVRRQIFDKHTVRSEPVNSKEGNVVYLTLRNVFFRVRTYQQRLSRIPASPAPPWFTSHAAVVMRTRSILTHWPSDPVTQFTASAPSSSVCAPSIWTRPADSEPSFCSVFYTSLFVKESDRQSSQLGSTEHYVVFGTMGPNSQTLS